MTLKVLIVDDEPPARRRLRALLRDEPDVEVIGECEDGDAALAALEHESADLVFLDVQMPGKDGLDVVRALGPRMPPVVFVTAYDRYALQAFEVHAVDYLLKPFDRQRLRRALERARTLRSAEPAFARKLLALVADLKSAASLRRVVVKSSGSVCFVDVDEIDWIEATGHYFCLHCGPKTHVVRGTLAALEQKLDAGRFVRIHRSTIVNVERIQELRPAFHGELLVILKDGTRLDCSRNNASRLARLLDA
jgi:two-component system LytT family response regulator